MMYMYPESSFPLFSILFSRIKQRIITNQMFLSSPSSLENLFTLTSIYLNSLYKVPSPPESSPLVKSTNLDKLESLNLASLISLFNQEHQKYKSVFSVGVKESLKIQKQVLVLYRILQEIRKKLASKIPSSFKTPLKTENPAFVFQSWPLDKQKYLSTLFSESLVNEKEGQKNIEKFFLDQLDVAELENSPSDIESELSQFSMFPPKTKTEMEKFLTLFSRCTQLSYSSQSLFETCLPFFTFPEFFKNHLPEKKALRRLKIFQKSFFKSFCKACNFDIQPNLRALEILNPKIIEQFHQCISVVEDNMNSSYVKREPCFENSVFVSLYSDVLLLDKNGVILNKIYGKNLVEFNPLQQSKNHLDLSDILANSISIFRNTLHTSFWGDLPFNEFLESYLSLDTSLQTTPFKSSYFYNNYPGVIGLFWIEFSEWPLYYRKTETNQLVLDLNIQNSRKNFLYPPRLRAFLNASLATWSNRLDSPTELPTKIVVSEFRGFCTYPIKTQLQTITDRWSETFPLRGQVVLDPVKKDISELHFLQKMFFFLFRPIFFTQRKPIWVRLRHEECLQDLHSTLPVTDRFSFARLFSLNSSSSFRVFQDQRELFTLLGLKFFLPEFFKQVPNSGVSLGTFQQVMQEIAKDINAFRKRCQRYQIRPKKKRPNKP